MKIYTCCFTGHRIISKSTVENILLILDHEIENLVAKGITTFLSGGALGFDQIAASMIIEKKKAGKNIRLTFALPCKNQDDMWNEKQKILYKLLLSEADEIIYVSEQYDDSCMKKRNEYMVENSSYCICALQHEKSGTGQTVRYARKIGLQVINILESSKSTFP